MLFNKAAVEAMHLSKPLGMLMRYGDRRYTVIGVTENIVMENPYAPVDPLMTYFRPDQSGSISVRLNKGAEPQKALAAIGSLFKKYNPAELFQYRFADQEFDRKFSSEELISRITNIFAGLAIFICCLGLAGLASFTIEKRVREIGIRKVLGASVGQILGLISKEFIRLVMIAVLVAVPLTWWIMDKWLEKYAFHIRVDPWIFLYVGCLIGLLALTVVSLNTLGSARRNPAKSLRTE